MNTRNISVIALFGLGCGPAIGSDDPPSLDDPTNLTDSSDDGSSSGGSGMLESTTDDSGAPETTSADTSTSSAADTTESSSESSETSTGDPGVCICDDGSDALVDDNGFHVCPGMSSGDCNIPLECNPPTVFISGEYNSLLWIYWGLLEGGVAATCSPNCILDESLSNMTDTDAWRCACECNPSTFEPMTWRVSVDCMNEVYEVHDLVVGQLETWLVVCEE